MNTKSIHWRWKKIFLIAVCDTIHSSANGKKLPNTQLQSNFVKKLRILHTYFRREFSLQWIFFPSNKDKEKKMRGNNILTFLWWKIFIVSKSSVAKKVSPNHEHLEVKKKKLWTSFEINAKKNISQTKHQVCRTKPTRKKKCRTFFYVF